MAALLETFAMKIKIFIQWNSFNFYPFCLRNPKEEKQTKRLASDKLEKKVSTHSGPLLFCSDILRQKLGLQSVWECPAGLSVIDQHSFSQIDIVQRTWPKFRSGISWYRNLRTIILKFTPLTFYFHGFYVHEFGKKKRFHPWVLPAWIWQKTAVP